MTAFSLRIQQTTIKTYPTHQEHKQSRLTERKDKLIASMFEKAAFVTQSYNFIQRHSQLNY